MHDIQQIRDHMEVFGADGVHVGVVDHVENSDRIMLSKNDPLAEGSHHFIPVRWIDHVELQGPPHQGQHGAHGLVEARVGATANVRGFMKDRSAVATFV